MARLLVLLAWSASSLAPLTRHAPPAPKTASAFAAARTGASVLGAALAVLGPALPVAAQIEDTAAVGKCVISQCTGKLAKCLTSPKCAANLVCINTCTGRADESECQIRCGDLFENDVIGEFNACAVSQKKCVPQRADDGAYPEPAAASVVEKFDTRLFEGRWYISEGLNQVFDTFACQVHFFTAPTPSSLYGQLNWRIQEPDGESFTKDVVQKFVADPKKPGILYNHDNEYLHYQDDWYILDYDKGKDKDDPNAFVLVYYRGRNDAWVGYGGAVLYTRTPAASPAALDRARVAWDKAELPYKFDAFVAPDNSCASESSSEKLLLREKFASKMAITGEKALQAEATNIRRAAANTVVKDAKGAEAAALKLETLVLDFEKGVEKEVVKDVTNLEKEVVKDVTSLEKEVEKDVGGLFKRK